MDRDWKFEVPDHSTYTKMCYGVFFSQKDVVGGTRLFLVYGPLPRVVGDGVVRETTRECLQ